MISTAVSVASFSVVLAESFAAVGLSTLVPAGAVTLARLVKSLGNLADADETRTGLETKKTALTAELKNSPAAGVTELLGAISASLPSLDLLLPKTAKIHAEFSFEGSEKYEMAGSVSAGGSYAGMVSASISEGWSALYESKSTNRITLDVDFVSVNIPL